jgi:UDP-N-acetyl-D-mannosaminuronic acid dehydrogenase
MEKVVVLGLGNIGFPVLKHVSKVFLKTSGFDIRETAIAHAIANGLKASAQLEWASIYVITVNTWYKGYSDMSAVENCVRKIGSLNPKALVCFESTLSIGTCRRLSRKYNLRYAAVCPHRWWKQDEANYGVVQTRVLGALNRESYERAIKFYCDLKIPVVVVSSLEVAEASKLVENTYFYLRIAYAEELKLMCNSNGIEFGELRRAVNTKWNVDMADAMEGIGGECLPKDILFLIESCQSTSLLKGAIASDIQYKKSLEPVCVAPEIPKAIKTN